MNSLMRMSQGDDFGAGDLTLVSQAMAEQLDAMAIKAELAMLAQRGISQIYARSEQTVLATLDVTERLKEGGRPIQMIPADLEAYHARRTTYLNQMSALTQYACDRLIQDALQAPCERQSTLSRLFGDILSGD